MYLLKKNMQKRFSKTVYDLNILGHNLSGHLYPEFISVVRGEYTASEWVFGHLHTNIVLFTQLECNENVWHGIRWMAMAMALEMKYMETAVEMEMERALSWHGAGHALKRLETENVDKSIDWNRVQSTRHLPPRSACPCLLLSFYPLGSSHTSYLRTWSNRVSGAPDLDLTLNLYPNPNLNLAIDCRVVSRATLSSNDLCVFRYFLLSLAGI